MLSPMAGANRLSTDVCHYKLCHYVSGLSVDCQWTVSGLSVECQCGLTDFVSQVLAVDCQWAVEDVGWLSAGGQRC